MLCLGVKPGAAGWKAQTNPLSYCGRPLLHLPILIPFLGRIRTYDRAVYVKAYQFAIKVLPRYLLKRRWNVFSKLVQKNILFQF